MKKLILLVFGIFLSLAVLAADKNKEKPTQHLKVAEVSSMKDAKEIFLEKTVEIRKKKNIGMQESAEIHVITYTLEKSVAYFAKNLKGKKQKLAKEMAVVVEDIHIASENNRLKILNKHLKKYSNLVDKFLFSF